MIPVITGAVSEDTGHIVYAYPFGGSRCLIRYWVETATKGTGKGQQRFCSQTTYKGFNYAYTERLERDGAEAANAWALEEVRAGRVHWNKPKCSTYNYVVVMFLQDLGDGSGRMGVEQAVLHIYSGPNDYAKFMERFTGFDESQLKQIESAKAYHRLYNRKTWEEYEAKVVPLAA